MSFNLGAKAARVTCFILATFALHTSLNASRTLPFFRSDDTKSFAQYKVAKSDADMFENDYDNDDDSVKQGSINTTTIATTNTATIKKERSISSKTADTATLKKNKPAKPTTKRKKEMNKAKTVQPPSRFTFSDGESVPQHSSWTPKKPTEHDAKSKIQYPVYVASLFKSGTTSAHAYFRCGKKSSAHTFLEKGPRIADCFRHVIEKKGPEFDMMGSMCGNYDVYADLWNLYPKEKRCYEPSLDGSGLENFYRHHPNATILLETRNVTEWVQSVHRWFQLPRRIRKYCKHPGFYKDWHLTTSANDTDLYELYSTHTEVVREFAKSHPSLTYIEVQLEDKNTGAILQDYTGIPRTCWGSKNVNKVHINRTMGG